MVPVSTPHAFWGFTSDQLLSGSLLPWTEISFIVFIAHEELLECIFRCSFIQKGCGSCSPGLHHSKSQTQHIGMTGATEMASNKSQCASPVCKLSTAVASLLFLCVHHVPATSLPRIFHCTTLRTFSLSVGPLVGQK